MDYTASCAVCRGPADPDSGCTCESQRLEMSISMAERRWLERWRENTREWVANHAITYVTQSFEKMKRVRLGNHDAYIRALPYWPFYERYGGRPPLPAHVVATLKRQMAEAEIELRRSIDADWHSCVIRYPEILNHYYSLVNVGLPKEVEPPPGMMPTIPTVVPHPIAAQQMHQQAAAQQKRERRSSKSRSATPADLEFDKLQQELHREYLAGTSNRLNGSGTTRRSKGKEAMTQDFVNQRPGGKKRHSGSGQYVMSGKGSNAPPQVPVPPNWSQGTSIAGGLNRTASVGSGTKRGGGGTSLRFVEREM